MWYYIKLISDTESQMLLYIINMLRHNFPWKRKVKHNIMKSWVEIRLDNIYFIKN